MQDIPIIDLAPLYEKDGLRYISQQLLEVYSNIGFAAIINTPIAPELVAQVFDYSQQFSNLSDDVKLSYKAGKHLRGYVPPKTSSLKKTGIGSSTDLPNHNESFAIVQELNDELSESLKDTSFGGTNLWPQELPQMQTVIMQFMNAMTELSAKLLQAFALAVGLCPNSWDHLLQPQALLSLRLLHYFRQPDVKLENLYGIAPHSDYGLMTFVAQDDVGGLQVRTPDGKNWIDVAPIKNSFVLNTADMLTRLSNGLLRSTPHRVISPSAKERYSMACFVSPNFDAKIKPESHCVATSGGKALYDSVTYRNYLGEIYANNYADLKK